MEKKLRLKMSQKQNFGNSEQEGVGVKALGKTEGDSRKHLMIN